MWFAVLIAVVSVFLTVTLHAFVLRKVTELLHHPRLLPGVRIGAAVYLVIFAHLVAVVVFGVGFYLGAGQLDAGSLNGEFGGDIREYIYFSLVSYTSLGLGDVYPRGPLRLITGVEALTGLLMIGWSATATYLGMSRYWRNPEAD